jgi:ribosomal protein S18 acetylase RimI-like enzyme
MAAASPVVVSEAQPEDLDAIAAIAQPTFEWHRQQVPGEFAAFDLAATRAVLQAAHAADGQFLLVARLNGDAVGFVHYYIIPRQAHGALAPLRMGFVEHIAVRAGHRRQGIGHALLEAARRHLRREAVTDLRANTFAANAASAAFLAAEGFGGFSTIHRARLEP